MKTFLTTFVICFIGLFVLLWIVVNFFANSLWALLFSGAFILAIFATICYNLSEQIEHLEGRIKQLEERQGIPEENSAAPEEPTTPSQP